MTAHARPHDDSEDYADLRRQAASHAWQLGTELTAKTDRLLSYVHCDVAKWASKPCVARW